MSNIPTVCPTIGARKSSSYALTIHLTTLIAFFAASSVPTPLYRLYQAEWDFSPALLTLIFGVYAFALLLALLVMGNLSDHIGRKPVISLALVLEIASMGLFLAAAGPGWLICARLMQGVATGLAAAALGAVLIDLDHERGPLANSLAPLIGMAVGALGATALVRFAPAPLRLIFVLLLAVFAVQLLQTWRTAETAGGRPGALQSLRPRVTIPQRAQTELLAITPINVALWALGGFYLSLMPSLIARVTESGSAWLGGLSVASLTLSGAAAIVLARQHTPLTQLVFGGAALIAGMVVTLVGANLGPSSVLLVGSVIAGMGFGAGFLGAVRSVMPLAEPTERAGLMAAFYLESYLAFSLPVIAAGYMARRLDLLTVTNLYGGAIMILVLAGVAFTLMRRRQVHRHS